MALCGYAIGASIGVVYIRAEYPLAIKRLIMAINDARAYGVLGQNIFGSDFSFDIELKYGAGAFVCGEETALIRSMEGSRGEPYTKPPFPPTPATFKRPSSTTLKLLPTFRHSGKGLSGSLQWTKSKDQFSPGQIPTLVSSKFHGHHLAKSLWNAAAARRQEFRPCRPVVLQAAQAFKDSDVPIDYDNLLAKNSMMGSGGMIVMDEDTCMVDIAKFFLDYHG
jgi:NADH:ubiquinone oxidoreductase subunit F (NADH-binding)